MFFTVDDRNRYLEWLKEYTEKHQVDVLAYCLMTNHIHLVLVTTTENGLQSVLKPLHMRYAQHVNRSQGWKGHLWQGRYFSSALDDAYTWAAIRYVERNPVRAGLHRKAEKYQWSSAAGHCGLREDFLISSKPSWQKQFKAIGDWSHWLAEGDDEVELNHLRRNADKGFPCGLESFVKKLEGLSGRTLRFKPQGRPRVENERVASPSPLFFPCIFSLA